MIGPSHRKRDTGIVGRFKRDEGATLKFGANHLKCGSLCSCDRGGAILCKNVAVYPRAIRG
jgi:hypothetical protein